MTYGDHIPFLDRELAILGAPPFDLSFQSFVEVLAHRGTPEVDAACRVFAATFHWPPLSDRQRLEACARLACAKWSCEVTREDPIDEKEPGGALLESLLIEYYTDVGRVGWLYEWIGLHSTSRLPPT
jgi:hypothetical protein